MNIKVVVIIVAIILLFPFVVKYWPKSLTFERIEDAFRDSGFEVTDVTTTPNPGLEAAEGASMLVNDAQVTIYLYDDRGKIAKNLEYQKPDAGSVIVEAWNLSESLGAAKPVKIPFAVGRNGMFMLTVTSESQELCNRILRAFEKA